MLNFPRRSFLKHIALLLATILLSTPSVEGRRKAKVKKKAKTTLVKQGPMAEPPADAENRFVTLQRPFAAPAAGLDGRNVALWPSHGRYFDKSTATWRWQRPRLFGTVEDLLTCDFVNEYLAPMLENAGAYVVMPRERDVSTIEIIADRDGSPEGDFSTRNGKHKWETTKNSTGFALRRPTLTQGENPFAMGNAAKVKTIFDPQKHKPSTASWYAQLPEQGKYAVYVSYPSFKNSAPDARYIVHHLGGDTPVTVNQRMGGGTWVYVGSFEFPANSPGPIVELTNISTEKEGKAVVAADAVKIGGGMGNVGRYTVDAYGNPTIAPYVSRLPRYAEGARYWLQWAGMPEKVYASTDDRDDYRDDVRSRALWVNHLAGGSRMSPDSAGLGIPIDLALAFHTDAGARADSSTVGTLGIYSTASGETLGNRRSRLDNHNLAQAVQAQVVADIRALYRTDWNDRQVKDKNYHECNAPTVPSMILELLSHQNFEDMRYGLNPAFRFDVSRAVYKGILRYFEKLYGKKLTVQPLPIGCFSIDYVEPQCYRLRWSPVVDTLETTAVPTSYLVERRTGSGGFEPLTITTDTTLTTDIALNHIYSYRVTAINDGGASFPSETLAVFSTGKEPDVLIVNGFDEVSAPGIFEAGNFKGFDYEGCPAVPFQRDIISVGPQYNFDTTDEYRDNTLAGFGSSRGTLERQTTGGNTFDFPYIHGKSISEAGSGFISTSAKAFARRDTSAWMPQIIDLVLGTQKVLDFRVPSNVKVFASGVHAPSILGFPVRTDNATIAGRVEGDPRGPFAGELFDISLSYSNALYPIGRLEALKAPKGYNWAMRYEENGLCAAIANSQAVVFAFPFEAIVDPETRTRLMKSVLKSLNQQNEK